MGLRTDLAIEAKRLWDTSAERKTELPGVKAGTSAHFGIGIEMVEVLDERGAAELGKPIGNYVTLDLSPFLAKEGTAFPKTAGALARVIRTMLPNGKRFLVAGLGNVEITPDSLGPGAVEHIIVTRHLQDSDNTLFSSFASVSAVVPGVLGKTGIESVRIVKSAAELVGADAVIVVDALASCEPPRLCRSVQITDVGIVPGSGVGNHRAAFTKAEFGIPVLAIGVPTVVDAGTFLSAHGVEDAASAGGLILSRRDIDLRVRELSKLIGYGINLALHSFLTVDDIPSLLS